MNIRRSRFTWLVVWMSVSILMACSHGGASAPSEKEETIELSVFAAASLTEAVKEIQGIYEREHPKVRLVPHFASSGKLQKQLEYGAEADFFLSAGTKEMNALLEKNLIDSDYHSDLLRNQLVLIIPKQDKEKWTKLQDLSQVEKVSIAQPDTVPAGYYAKQALEDLGLWEELQNRIVFSGDVRQVLTYVETGNVNAGLVYQTDALTTDKVSVVTTINPDSHEPILYPMGVLKASKHPEEARELYEWLRSEKAQSIFEKYGFQVL